MTASKQEGSTGALAATVPPARTPGVETLPLLLLSAVFEDPQTGIIIFDAQLRLLHVTSHAPRLLELPPQEEQTPARALNVLELLSLSTLDPLSLENAKRGIMDFSGAAAPLSILLQSPDQSRSVRMRLRSVGDAYRIASFEAVAFEKGAPPAIADSAVRDSLTGLATRDSFEEFLTQRLESALAAPVTLLLIDLDRFKAVNDTLGHAAGNAVLKLAAERLKAAAGKYGTVARLGGDEFAVLMDPALNHNDTVLLANRILDLVQRTYLIEGHLVNVGTSIGISQSASDGSQAASLLRSADLALYHSKAPGRPRFHFFEEEMQKRAQARRVSELELRRALAFRQLELFYQPQVDTTKNRLLGFEALLRWRHPERGMIPPGDFLPIAEEIGVIVPIGDWALRTACREAMNWPAHLTVAVNVSPLQFDACDYAESVKRALERSGLPGERLEIEITEGIMLRNDSTVLDTLEALRAMKVRIAMDDFGTGYASLSQLARFPFDKIKIDRSLVGSVVEDPKQRAIVRAITALGPGLGVSILAEGIETAEQLARLQGDGCTAVQGYFYSKPVPANQISDILERFA
jgi:diguanylate cyclase (GGDEF)-like protein